jgi:hypothetical protein
VIGILISTVEEKAINAASAIGTAADASKGSLAQGASSKRARCALSN